jgi:uncharacterized membrane protein YecN with MAPEG domain
MPVTSIYAGLLALWFLVLGVRVIRGRRAGPSLGDGGDPRMLRLIRGHANFAEYVPLIVVMMGLLELGHTSIYLLHAVGIALLAGRLLHGYAFSFTDHFKFGRFWGSALTFLVLGVCAGLCILQGIRGMAVI